MSHGISIKIESHTNGWIGQIWSGLTALLFYTALWGALCSMASLSTLGVLPLAAGGVLAVLPALFPDRREARLTILAVGLGVAVLLIIFQWQTAADGVKLFLNRFFAASETRQAYTYEMFDVSANEAAWQNCIRYALIHLGLISGMIVATAFHLRIKSLLVVTFAAFAGWVAYLGVSPAWGWTVALAAALLLAFPAQPSESPALPRLALCGAGLTMLALICGAVLMLAPGEDERLSAWDEQVRDALALSTVAYSDQQRDPAENNGSQSGNTQQFQEEDTPPDLDGEDFSWPVPPAALAAIIIAALLLFIPAILSDLLKKRRARNRQDLDDPDNNVSIRAMFLYSLRWLKIGGLTPENVPFSDYAGQVGTVLSETHRAAYEEILPLWQEAAYSTHVMTNEQRARMLGFIDQTQQAVWQKLSKKDRLLAKYYYAL